MTSRIAELEAEVAQLRAELSRSRRALDDDRRSIERTIPAPRPAFVARLPGAVFVLDEDDRFEWVSDHPFAARFRAEVGTGILDRAPPEERARVEAVLAVARTTATTQSLALAVPAGATVELRFLPLGAPSEPAPVLVLADEAAEHRAHAAALLERENHLRHALRASGLGTWIRHPDGAVWDETLARILGLEPSSEMRPADAFLDTIHPDDRRAVFATVERFRKTGRFDDIECRVLWPDGTVRFVLVKAHVETNARGELVRSYGAVLDLTERKALEAKLRESQKMDAIGRLTAGVAHHFNNVLGIVMPNLELARRDAPAELVPRLELVERAATRGATLVRRLMPFARETEIELGQPVDLGACVRAAMEACRATFDPRIRFELELGEPLPRVRGDAELLTQALIDVFRNARDAFAEGHTEHPRITISECIAKDGFVGLVVQDDGPGMDEAIVGRAFEPFFSTRGLEGGLGLGLASVYAIVTRIGGQVRCESRPGLGTSILFELPRCTESTCVNETPSTSDAGAGALVLVVDDEPLVRLVVRELLELEDLAVLEAEDGPTALRILAERHHEIAAVLLDRAMPGMPGEEVLDKLHADAFDVPVVMHTGHLGERARFAAAFAILEKPARADDLLSTVRRAIASRRDRHSSD